MLLWCALSHCPGTKCIVPTKLRTGEGALWPQLLCPRGRLVSPALFLVCLLLFPMCFCLNCFAVWESNPCALAPGHIPVLMRKSAVEARWISSFTPGCDKALDKKQPDGLLTWFSDSLRVAAPHEGKGNNRSVRHPDTWYSSRKSQQTGSWGCLQIPQTHFQ